MQQLNQHLNGEIQPVLFCVDCQPPEWLAELPRIRAMPMTHEQNYGTSESTSIEHGSFIALLPGHVDDLFIKADGDMVMQRPFDDEEMEWLSGFPAASLGGAWNAGIGDNLHDESLRLRPKVNALEMARRFPLYEGVPCLNGGVLIARRDAYRRLYDCYMQRWTAACDSFNHYARQQWLINYSAYAAGLEFVELSPAIHAQGHYGLPDGVEIIGDTVWYRNGHSSKTAVFRHKL